MAHPATRPAAQGPCNAPPVHPVDEKLPLARPVPAGGFPASAYAQNVGAVSLTRGRSRYAVAGGVLLVLGAFPVLGAVVPLVPMPVLGGAGIVPLAAPTFHADYPARAQTVLGSGISAGALLAVLLNLFFHQLGTRSRQAVALKSS